jgi:LysM repeat protein
MKISKLIFLFLYLLPLYSIAQKTATLIYIDQYKDIAVSEMKRTGIPASITLAQGIIESNSGESNLALNFKNHFGIKCKSDWKGETTYQDDDSKKECFRVYPNAAASFVDHSNFLKTRPNYAPLFELDPVDDSAWAYGLKKAGYATASDYPKKLLKVINDFELSQYNFPELDIFDNEDTPIQKIDTSKVLPPTKDTSKPFTPKLKLEDIKNDTLPTKPSTSITQPTTPIIVKDSLKVTDAPSSHYIDTIQLSSIKGVISSDSIKNTTPTPLKGIGSIDITSTPEKLVTKDSVTKKNTTAPIVFPKGKFKANQLLAIYAKAGSSFLDIATTYNIALYKLYVYNDLKETELVLKDQILYLVPKRKEVSKKVHRVTAGESLYDISQIEGIQLNYLMEYNAGINDQNLSEGATLVLFKSSTPAPVSSLSTITPIKKEVKKVEIKDTLKKKPFDFIKKIIKK